MPVHTQYTAQCLEPEGVAETLQYRATAIFHSYGFYDSYTQFAHALVEPGRYLAIVQWHICIGAAHTMQFTEFETNAECLSRVVFEQLFQTQYGLLYQFI